MNQGNLKKTKTGVYNLWYNSFMHGVNKFLISKYEEGIAGVNKQLSQCNDINIKKRLNLYKEYYLHVIEKIKEKQTWPIYDEWLKRKTKLTNLRY